MAEHKLAGLSVAVFDGYELVDAHTFGIKSVVTGEPIEPTTAFSTASISKPVTALICLMLHEEGVIDLDTPVAGYLKSWRIPQSEHAGTADVTWRQLLTHTAGTSQHGFADYYEGDTIPTLVDSLEGRIPRYDKPIEFEFSPGSDWQYSGGGYVVVQLALEDHLGRSLPELAAEKVFEPLGMEHSTMEQPGSPQFPADVALVHDEGGAVIRTGIPITPQISASGMWSTPADLVKFAIAIQRALAGDNLGAISPSAAQELTDIHSLKHVGGMGMPFFRGFGFANTDWFRHDGSNTGVNGDLMASMNGGYGIVMLGNGDDANTGPVFAKLRREILSRMSWKRRVPVTEVPLDPIVRKAVIGTYRGLLYDLELPYQIEERGGRLWVLSPFFDQFLGREESEMWYLGGGEFAIEDYPNRVQFHLSGAESVESVSISRPGSKAPAFSRPIAALRP